MLLEPLSRLSLIGDERLFLFDVNCGKTANTYNDERKNLTENQTAVGKHPAIRQDLERGCGQLPITNHHFGRDAYR